MLHSVCIVCGTFQLEKVQYRLIVKVASYIGKYLVSGLFSWIPFLLCCIFRSYPPLSLRKKIPSVVVGWQEAATRRRFGTNWAHSPVLKVQTFQAKKIFCELLLNYRLLFQDRQSLAIPQLNKVTTQTAPLVWLCWRPSSYLGLYDYSHSYTFEALSKIPESDRDLLLRTEQSDQLYLSLSFQCFSWIPAFALSANFSANQKVESDTTFST